MSRVTNSSRAARTGSAQGVTGLLNKPQVRGGLLTSSRSFDSRTQVGMRFKGSKEKDKEEVKCTNSVAGTTTSATAEMTTGMFRKSRDISVATASSRHSMAAQSQVAATPVKRTRPVLTSFTAEPDNPFINDSHVVDESPFAKRMRGRALVPGEGWAWGMALLLFSIVPEEKGKVVRIRLMTLLFGAIATRLLWSLLRSLGL